MQYNPVRWFEIYVQDMPRAVKFYEEVFQLKLEKLDTPDTFKQPDAPEFEIWAFPMAPDKVGCGGALVRMEGYPSGQKGSIVYFASEDCSVEAGRIISAGGQIQAEKLSIGQYGHIALGFDTEGNIFGIHSME